LFHAPRECTDVVDSSRIVGRRGENDITMDYLTH